MISMKYCINLAHKKSRQPRGRRLSQVWLLSALGKPDSLIQYVTDRPGHDRRYAMDNTFIRSRLGWRPERALDEALAETVEWYLGNQRWWERVQSEA